MVKSLENASFPMLALRLAMVAFLAVNIHICRSVDSYVSRDEQSLAKLRTAAPQDDFELRQVEQRLTSLLEHKGNVLWMIAGTGAAWAVLEFGRSRMKGRSNKTKAAPPPAP